MIDKKEVLKGMIRESSRQNKENVESLSEYEKYYIQSPGSNNIKLENFTKYVTRESLTKFLTRNEIFQKQLNINGSIIEMGVARGASLMSWYHLSSIYEPTNYLREIIGFDTFEGFPEITDMDIQSKMISEHTKEGGFQVEAGMNEDILQSAWIADKTRFLGHIPKLKLIKGDLLKTLPEYLKDNPHLVVSLLHLDVDLYEPTKFALELLVPRMPKGAVIVFDELNMRQFPGETTAAIEAIGLNNLKLKRFPYATCMSYAIIGE